MRSIVDSVYNMRADGCGAHDARAIHHLRIRAVGLWMTSCHNVLIFKDSALLLRC